MRSDVRVSFGSSDFELVSSFGFRISNFIPMILRARQFEFSFPRPTLLMGIVNVTPDSFSDGGRFFGAEAAVEHGLRLVEEGAEVIDVGGESTRPGAVPVGEEEELRRVLPVIGELGRRVKVPISIDTMKASVARRAVEAGASIVNDVAAPRQGEEMWRFVAESGAAYVCMHARGTPQTMQEKPSYTDVVAEVEQFLERQLGRLAGAGIAAEQIILDVGIGFGKTAEHNLQLLASMRTFTKLGRPVLLGVSRKSFLGKMSGTEADTRLPGSLACACLAVEAGIQILRVHDVAETVQAVRMTEAILSKRS
jgi:dihydropteroate synthase